MTRAGPAKSLGLRDRGHVGAGASADITVYEDLPDREAMFKTPLFVFKNGELIVRNGKVVKVVAGATHVARPEYDRAIEKPLREFFDRYHTVKLDNFRVSDQEVVESNCGHTGGECGCVIVQPCGPRVS
jgi:formylmethanofuran dehydrogenase subunit A